MDLYFNQFNNDCFCIIPRAISPDLVDRVNKNVDDFLGKNLDRLNKENLLVDGMLQRIVNFHHSINSLKQVFVDSMEMGHTVVDKYGQATLYTSLFFELGSQQSLHRDTPYFYSGGQGGYMGVWVALEDVDENNGALLAVKGSHYLPEPNLEKLKELFHPNEDVPPSSTPLFNAYNQELIDAADRMNLEKVVCKVNKGDMIIWNPSTLHGGLAHHDKSRSRRSFVMHITPKNMPMMHMDYFFNRQKKITPISRDYINHKGRLIVDGDVVDFRHVKQFKVTDLGEFS